jgi:outer membrane protein assembly factor BamD (BamD/ComL family)
MSIAGIASSLYSQISNLQSSQQTSVRSEFQQLAQDLQSGNLSQAQTDFATLQQSDPALQSGGNSPLQQAFTALGKDLQSGNLPAAQQEFTAIQQVFSQAAQPGGQVHHHHHHHASSSQDTSSSSSQTSLSQLFTTLGQDLQTGNLNSAQQAYSALQQDLPWLSSSTATAAPVSVSA